MANYGDSSKLYVIPQDEENRMSLLNVDRNTKEDIRQLYRLYEDHDWSCNTIANAYLEIVIRTLALNIKNTGNKSEFDFFGLFNAYVTVKRNENAEKEGNINIAFECGDVVSDIITDTTPRESRELEYITPEARFANIENESMCAAYLKIDKTTKLDLQNKYGLIIPKDWAITAITFTFIENIFKELLYKLKMTDKTTSSINFNDNIEAHAIINKETDEVMITLRPGMNAKLLIKSDETTESEDDED